tara:strand:- start:254 stop:466 length:213 start_codon:yes stop_codon:yes gene_type:complete
LQKQHLIFWESHIAGILLLLGRDKLCSVFLEVINSAQPMEYIIVSCKTGTCPVQGYDENIEIVDVSAYQP